MENLPGRRAREKVRTNPARKGDTAAQTLQLFRLVLALAFAFALAIASIRLRVILGLSFGSVVSMT